MFWIGTIALLLGLVGRLVVMPLVIPRGKVFEPQPGQLDRIVELRNVHPAFVMSVQQQQSTRAAQLLAPG